MKENNKIDLIYKSLLTSIAKYGLNTPMSKIVKESGISTGVFYHYFKNKEKMIEELYKKVKYDFLDATLCDMNEEYLYFEQFSIIWKNSLDYLISNPNVLNLFRQFENAPQLIPQLEDIHIEKVNIYKSFIENGIKRGLVKELPLILISDLTISFSMQVAKNVINNVITLDQKLIDDLIASSWNSIKKC